MKKIVEPLLTWYKTHQRDLPWRINKDPYRIWISEIMLQQTQVNTVIPYYLRFMERCPDLESLATVDEESLLKLWQGLGYYSRAKNLKVAANQILHDFNGIFPMKLEDLLSLKGIGPYTAGAISSIAFDQKNPAIDGNVLRVYSRIKMANKDIQSSAFKKEVYEDLKAIYPNEAGDFTQSLMELGALICSANGMPKCEICPLNQYCLSHLHRRELDFPISNKKLKRKVEKRTVLILEVDGTYAIQKRDEGGLLSSMWELINLKGHLNKDDFIDLYDPFKIQEDISHKHIFSHIEWDLKSYHLILNKKDPRYTWASFEEIEQTYALASAFLPFIKKKNQD